MPSHTRDVSGGRPRASDTESQPSADGCPLCEEHEARTEGRISMVAIWDALRDQFGAQFSKDVRERHSPVEEVELRECAGCGLLWFSPKLAGNAAFYTELMGVAPYNAESWEFKVVTAQLRRGETVVDFGCGRGAFLRMLEGRVGRRVGVDHNLDAVGALATAGIEGFTSDFATFARRHPATFDVASAFQVMEHLPRVADLLEPMAAVVRPGGRLYVAVPNAERYGRAALEPFDCPPHHVTRWRATQLPHLARRFGLELSMVALEPLSYTAAIAVCMRPFERLSGRLPHHLPHRGLRWAWRHTTIGPGRYHWAVANGLFRRLELHGHSILVELRRPLDDASHCVR